MSPPLALSGNAKAQRPILKLCIGIAVMIICVVPPLLVQNSTTASRVIWYSSAASLLVTTLISNAARKPLQSEYKYRFHIHLYSALMLTSFAVAVLLSVFFANTQSMQGTSAAVAAKITAFTQPLFPWLGNFRLSLSDFKINELQSLKIQAIQSVWFLYGAAFCLLLFFRRWAMTDNYREAHDNFQRQRYVPRSGAVVLACVCLGLVMAVMAYSGAGQFDATRSRRGCLLKLQCYYDNDLAIIAAAGLNSFAIFGFSAGAFLMVRAYLKQRA